MLTLVATQAAFCFVIYFAAGLLVKTFERLAQDRKSTRLNSSHRCTSYAVFCLKKNSRLGRWRGQEGRTKNLTLCCEQPRHGIQRLAHPHPLTAPNARGRRTRQSQ